MYGVSDGGRLLNANTFEFCSFSDGSHKFDERFAADGVLRWAGALNRTILLGFVRRLCDNRRWSRTIYILDLDSLSLYGI